MNHTVKLDLDSYTINLRPLNVWYGLASSSNPKSFKAEKLWISFVDRTLYIEGRSVGNLDTNLVGVISWEDGVLIAQSQELTLYSSEGQVFDQKNGEELPGKILAIGKTGDNMVAVKTGKGVFFSDVEMEQWQPITKENVIWSMPSNPPEKLTKAVIEAHSGRGLPASRIILDLHSGRIFGQWGLYLMDAAAIFLLFLTMTGLYNWSKRKR